MDDPLPRWAEKLTRCGPVVPEQLAGTIRAEGVAARPVLLRILRGGYATDGEIDDDDQARLHSLDFLAELPPDDATIRALIDFVVHSEIDDLTDAAVSSLRRFGAAAVEPLLETLPSSTGLVRVDFVDLLGTCGVKDERIFRVLCGYVDTDFGVRALVWYGDRAAIPVLRNALARYEFEAEPRVYCDDRVIGLTEAIRRLGGTLEPEEAEKVLHVRRRRRRAVLDAGLDPDTCGPLAEFFLYRAEPPRNG